MRKENREISQTRCSITRECNTQGCVFKMLSCGYKSSPRSELDKQRNIQMERICGKGFFPDLSFVGRDDFIDVVCNSYTEKR